MEKMGHLKRITTVLMILLLFVQVNQIAVFQFMFYLNQANISKSNCERVVVNCNGKCFLAKQVQKNAENTATAPTKPSSVKVIELVSLEYLNGLKLPWYIQNKMQNHSSEKIDLYTFRLIASNFHPPQLS